MTEERILDVTTVTTRYQITLTKAVRKLLNVEMGDRIVFVKKGDEIVIRKA
jgi:AbrB family looped-hinge helix DNA binding protein